MPQLPLSITDKIARHHCFWTNQPAERPLVGFVVGDYFPAKRLKAGHKLLHSASEITCPMVNPQDYFADCLD